MPKKSQFPKLRTYVKRGKDGRVWTSYAFDMRGTGKADVPLGTDRAQALERWAALYLEAPLIAGTLEEAFKGWEKRGMERKPDGTERKGETIAGYRKCLKAMRPAFGGARWEEVKLPDLRRYIDHRSAKGRARQEMQLLSVIWGWARLEGLTELHFPGEGMQKSGWKGVVGKRQVEVTDEAFEALYKHADQTLRDALDIATATGLRVMDVLKLKLADVRNGELVAVAGKTGNRGDFDLGASAVLPLIIARRQGMTTPEHDFILTAGSRPVTYRRLAARFERARAAAALEVPACAGLILRDMRKRAASLAPTLAAASTLLQHSSLAVTRRHYRQGDKLKPVR